MSFTDWLDRGRAWWKAKPSRVIEAESLVVVDATNTVRAVGRIAGVMKDLEGATGRVSIEVLPTPDSDLIGKTIARSESRNPVGYVTEIEVIAG